MLPKAGGGPVGVAGGSFGGGAFPMVADPSLPIAHGGSLGDSCRAFGFAEAVSAAAGVGCGCTTPNLAAAAAVRVISDRAHASGNRRHMGAY